VSRARFASGGAPVCGRIERRSGRSRISRNRHRSRRALVAAVAFLAAGNAGAQDVFVAGGTLVDPASRQTRESGLLILDGVVRGLAPEPPPGFRGAVVDARGRWVIPGLHDLHVHSLVNLAPRRERELVGTPATARRMLFAGVTGFLELFNEEEYVLALRDDWRAESSAARADLYAAGPCLTAPGGHCTQYPATTRTIDSPAEARRQVAELAKRRPDVVKIAYDARPLPTFDEETLRAAIAAATEHRLRTVVHVGNWEEARRAALAGATAITHVDPDEEISLELARLLAERGVYFIPTMVLYGGLVDLAGGSDRLQSTLLLQLAPEKLVAAYRDERTAGGRAYQFLSAARPRVLASVRRLAEAGVPLLSGTDSGNWGTLHGYSLHHELALMVEAGLEPWEALRASTAVAGEFLGRSWGLQPGAEGSVVVLEASPLADIRNTEKIVAVVHHGRVVDRDRLASSLFPPPWSSEIAAVVWAHLRPRHLLALGAVLGLVVGGAVGLRRLRAGRRGRGAAVSAPG
jgi:imidazolonepropionase-like amidohydrolase